MTPRAPRCRWAFCPGRRPEEAWNRPVSCWAGGMRRPPCAARSRKLGVRPNGAWRTWLERTSGRTTMARQPRYAVINRALRVVTRKPFWLLLGLTGLMVTGLVGWGVAGTSIQPASILYLLYVGISLLLGAIAATTLIWMVHAWRTPESFSESHLRRDKREPTHTFSLIVPARHEEAGLEVTLERLSQSDHPAFEIIVVVGDDDPGTRQVAERVAAGRPGRVRVVIDSSFPKNKPRALNTALPYCRGTIAGVFDAEDDVHPDLLHRVDQCFQLTDADIVQAGVQLMNFRSSLLTVHNVLEYYFWFRSRLHRHARQRFIPLGGNTVFIRTKVLRWANGWDAECLAEDCELGVRLSSLGARTAVFYEPELVTREECPSTLSAFIRQRTRWNQGYLQTLSKGYWRQLPLRQKALGAYILAVPFAMAIAWVMIPIAIGTAVTLKAPVGITMISFLPAAPMLAMLIVDVVGLGEFCRTYHERASVRDYARLVLGLPLYQAVLSFAAARAVIREARGVRGWEKTAHLGLHIEAQGLAGSPGGNLRRTDPPQVASLAAAPPGPEVAAGAPGPLARPALRAQATPIGLSSDLVLAVAERARAGADFAAWPVNVPDRPGNGHRGPAYPGRLPGRDAGPLWTRFGSVPGQWQAPLVSPGNGHAPWRRRLSGRKRLSGRVLGISKVLAAHLCGTGAGRLSIAVVAAAAVLQALLILRFGHDARSVWLSTLVATCALTVSLGAVVTVRVPAVRAHTLELLAVLTRPTVLPSAITALGLSVRLIVPRGLWLDDMTSVYDARLPFSTMLHVLQTTDDHPPLYFSILWVTIRVFGDTEMSVRIPSIVIGTLVLPMLYLLGKEAYDRRTGAIAAVAGIAAPLMVWYSQEARMYELLMLLGAIAMWAQVRILRVGPSWRLWTVYALCCAGLTWTQYFGSFQVIAQELVFCVVLFVRRHDGTSTRRLLLGFLLSSLAIAAILMPLVPFAHQQFLMGKAAGSMLGPQGSSFGNHLGIYTELANLVWAVWGYHSNATMVLLCSLWPLGILFAHGLLGSQPRGITGLLLAGVLVPGLLLLALGRIEGSSLGIFGLATNVRYLSTTVPLLFILIARVVTGVLHSKKLAAFVTCALLVSLGAALIDEQYDGSNPRLYDFRGALLHIDKVVRPDDVLLYDGKLVELVKYYSPQVHARPLVSTPPLPSAGRTVYMIASPSLLYAANEEVLKSALQAEQSRGRLARRLHYDNVEVWIFRER
jgi:cellulose synthase/poly-beta-1,6-N-acetylglucosamine synthase-like glycosyltransferase